MQGLRGKDQPVRPRLKGLPEGIGLSLQREEPVPYPFVIIERVDISIAGPYPEEPLSASVHDPLLDPHFKYPEHLYLLPFEEEEPGTLFGLVTGIGYYVYLSVFVHVWKSTEQYIQCAKTAVALPGAHKGDHFFPEAPGKHSHDGTFQHRAAR